MRAPRPLLLLLLLLLLAACEVPPPSLPDDPLDGGSIGPEILCADPFDGGGRWQQVGPERGPVEPMFPDPPGPGDDDDGVHGGLYVGAGDRTEGSAPSPPSRGPAETTSWRERSCWATSTPTGTSMRSLSPRT